MPDDKEARTKVHTSLKKHFPGLDSKTTVHEGEKCIEVTFVNQKSTCFFPQRVGLPRASKLRMAKVVCFQCLSSFLLTEEMGEGKIVTF